MVKSYDNKSNYLKNKTILIHSGIKLSYLTVICPPRSKIWLLLRDWYNAVWQNLLAIYCLFDSSLDHVINLKNFHLRLLLEYIASNIEENAAKLASSREEQTRYNNQYRYYKEVFFSRIKEILTFML